MALQGVVFYNNAGSTLGDPVAPSDTTIVLVAGGGSQFSPPLGSGQYFIATITSDDNPAFREVVHVTNVTGDTLTVVRAQEGTHAGSWQVGDLFQALVTAGCLATALQQNQFVSFAGNPNGAVAGFQAAAPFPPTMCWDFTDEILWACIQTGTASNAQWKQSYLLSAILTGTIHIFAGASAPPGFLLCNGGAYNRVTYAPLFGAIGTTYGSGDGSTTFNVPDLRGRLVAGIDNMGGTPANRLSTFSINTPGALGGVGGTEKVAIAVSTLPSHTHTNTDPGHSHSISDQGHFHIDPSNTAYYNPAFFGGGYTIEGYAINPGSVGGFREGAYTNSATSGISVNSGTTNITNQPTGNSNPHVNIQPTVVMNYVIAI